MYDLVVAYANIQEFVYKHGLPQAAQRSGQDVYSQGTPTDSWRAEDPSQ